MTAICAQVAGRLLAVVALFSFGLAFADERVKTTDGRELLLRSDGTYEILSGDSDDEDAGYRSMSITDLKLDSEKLIGQQVEVMVSLAMFGGMVMLSDARQPFDTSPIPASIDELPRADREFILSRCNTGCQVTVRGEVAMIMFQPGLMIKALDR